MTINEVLELANSIKKKFHELNNWDITFNNRKKSFGCCSYGDREIQLSKYLIGYMSEYAIKNTIIHEIAHALTPNHGHDYVWRRKFIELGGNGKRVSGSENFENGLNGEIAFLKNTAKYTLTCPVCGYAFYVNRKPKYECSCGKHGEKTYNPKYKLVLSENR